MARKSSYIKVTGCVEAKQRKVRDDVGDATYIRVENIIEMCEVVGTQRLREASTKAEYDAREPGTDDDWDVRPDGSPPYWHRYVPTTELTLGFVEHHLSRTEYSHNTPATRVHIGLLVPESIEALIARIDATEFPPPPAPEEPPAAVPMLEVAGLSGQFVVGVSVDGTVTSLALGGTTGLSADDIENKVVRLEKNWGAPANSDLDLVRFTNHLDRTVTITQILTDSDLEPFKKVLAPGMKVAVNSAYIRAYAHSITIAAA